MCYGLSMEILHFIELYNIIRIGDLLNLQEQCRILNIESFNNIIGLVLEVEQNSLFVTVLNIEYKSDYISQGDIILFKKVTFEETGTNSILVFNKSKKYELVPQNWRCKIIFKNIVT